MNAWEVIMGKEIEKKTARGATVISEGKQRELEKSDREAQTKASKRQASAQEGASDSLADIAAAARSSGKWSKVAAAAAVLSALAAILSAIASMCVAFK